MENKQVRIITTAPGIGDFAWVLMKLINQKEKFDFVFPVRDAQEGDKANVQTRAFQLEKLLPQLINSSIHKRIKFDRAIRGGTMQYFSDAANRQEFIIEANSHMEAGRRIETFLPDLETSFIIPFETTEQNKKEAEAILEPFKNGFKVCGIYTSNQEKRKADESDPEHSSWLESEWIEMINLIRKHDPGYRFVFIAAEYDRPLTEAVMKGLDREDYATCINQELGTVIELLKRLDIFISFQSGLSILGELVGTKQTVMLYWNDQAHRNIIEAWPDPERIKSGQYKGAIFCPPIKIFEWLVTNKKL